MASLPVRWLPPTKTLRLFLPLRPSTVTEMGETDPVVGTSANVPVIALIVGFKLAKVATALWRVAVELVGVVGVVSVILTVPEI
jgi:hypothetical protein